MLAPMVARWLLIELIAVSNKAMAAEARVVVVTDEVLIPRLAVVMEVITTLMVCPLAWPAWYENVPVAFIKFVPFHED